MFVACSDARVVPSLLTGSRPGDLFELRVHGGQIPRSDTHAPLGKPARSSTPSRSSRSRTSSCAGTLGATSPVTPYARERARHCR
ncbi:carbonic anhydrase [Streptomyces sp. NPDC048484]|uniref:carbonic anhydrase n=1 Tax=Streptomyces sp. NPDC048484 TaxID=3155146 RepID=UPI003418F446